MDALRDWIAAGLWVAAVVAIGGIVLASLRLNNMHLPDSKSELIFVRLFAENEVWGIAILAFFLLATMLVCLRVRYTEPRLVDHSKRDVPTRHVIGVALGSGILSAVITLICSGRYPLSMDEYAMRFQASIFGGGAIVAEVPQAIQDLGRLVRPVFVVDAANGNGWISGYSPVYSLILVPFEWIELTWIVNPLFSALAIVAIWRIAKDLWPGDADRQTFAVVSLALCSQVIMTGATNYAMPAHLSFNLWWLVCSRSQGVAKRMTGPLGVLAIGLHQPLPHALFVAPFLIRKARNREWSTLLELGTWYTLALIGLFLWNRQLTGLLPLFGDSGILGWPRVGNVSVMLMNIVLAFTWQTPLVALGAAYAVRNYRCLSQVERDLLAGVVLSLAFYLAFRMVTQGHGWGWRYGHQVLGNIVLLAASSMGPLRRAVGRASTVRLVLLSFALSGFVQTPIRAYDVRALTLPYARAGAWLSGLPYSIVLVPADSVWYGRDLIRNLPTTGGPLIVNSSSGEIDQQQLAALGPGSAGVRIVLPRELIELGLQPVH